MSKPVVYLAHPVSAPTKAGVNANLTNARAWLKWLVDHTTWAISCPWMAYVETLSEEKYRARGLSDDLAMIGRHSGLILVGGRISTGMEVERQHALHHAVPVLDWSSEVSPPSEVGRIADLEGWATAWGRKNGWAA